MRYLLALDQGTTSSRALVYDEQLSVCGSAQRPLEQFFPNPGWVEHDPLEIWRSQCAVANEAVARAQLPPDAIIAVGISNQRETTVLWERAGGTPLHRALVWQDRRTADACEARRAAGVESLIQAKTGLLIDPYFCASKIHWLLEQCPGARVRAARGELAVGTIDSWLIWNLTRGRCHLTDASNASRTMLYNLTTGDWDDELLALWDIPREILPEITDSSGELAEIDGGLEFRARLTGVAGDQQAALFGQTCFNAGDAKCTFGTGCFVLRQSGQTIPHSKARLLSTVAWSHLGVRSYALEGSVFMGGAIVQWLRDGLGIIESAAEIETLARSVPDNGGVVLVPAFTGLGAPYWDPHARGLLIGLTRGTTRAHIARAALEAIALQVTAVLNAMEGDSNERLISLKVDGGAAANSLLMQLQSDLLGCPLEVPADLETTARGAASLAGIGAGVWPDFMALAALNQPSRVYAPHPANVARVTLQERWQAAVSRARHWTA
ncbi:MAG: glycerol kinase [Gammaproteobacteria bacterium]|nr:glycerol kinase [Gammaproteobacteria bacterium]